MFSSLRCRSSSVPAMVFVQNMNMSRLISGSWFVAGLYIIVLALHASCEPSVVEGYTLDETTATVSDSITPPTSSDTLPGNPGSTFSPGIPGSSTLSTLGLSSDTSASPDLPTKTQLVKPGSTRTPISDASTRPVAIPSSSSSPTQDSTTNSLKAAYPCAVNVTVLFTTDCLQCDGEEGRCPPGSSLVSFVLCEGDDVDGEDDANSTTSYCVSTCSRSESSPQCCPGLYGPDCRGKLVASFSDRAFIFSFFF